MLAIALHDWQDLHLVYALLALSFRASIVPVRDSDEVIAWDSSQSGMKGAGKSMPCELDALTGPFSNPTS